MLPEINCNELVVKHHNQITNRFAGAIPSRNRSVIPNQN